MGSDAISDILNSPRFQGAVDSLSGVTGALDTIFISFISIIAFFIISSALLKNVIAGAYAAYPRLFDKVHDAKEFSIGKVESLGTIGSVMGFFLSLLPDFKEMSEFRDDTIAPKDYFIKAIPQMIMVVMIGVVIYNGYYRDFVAKFAKFGTEIITRVLYATDPVAMLDKITNTVANPTLASDMDNTAKGQLTYKISKKMYQGIIGNYTDITTTAAKTDLSTRIESWVGKTLDEAGTAGLLDENKWSSSYKIDMVLGDVAIDQLKQEDTAKEQVVKVWLVPISDFGIDSGKHIGEDWRIRLVVQFTKEHKGTVSTGTVSDLLWSIDNSALASTSTKSAIKLPAGYLAKLQIAESATIDGKRIKVEGDTITLEGKSSNLDGHGKVACQGITYKSDNMYHTIQTIQLTGTGYKLSSSKIDEANFGDNLVVKGTADAAAADKAQSDANKAKADSSKSTSKSTSTDTSNSTKSSTKTGN